MHITQLKDCWESSQRPKYLNSSTFLSGVSSKTLIDQLLVWSKRSDLVPHNIRLRNIRQHKTSSFPIEYWRKKCTACDVQWICEMSGLEKYITVSSAYNWIWQSEHICVEIINENREQQQPEPFAMTMKPDWLPWKHCHRHTDVGSEDMTWTIKNVCLEGSSDQLYQKLFYKYCSCRHIVL